MNAPTMADERASRLTWDGDMVGLKRDYVKSHIVDRLIADVGRHERALEAIIIRCEEGDKRSDWLPTIACIAHVALKPSEIAGN